MIPSILLLSIYPKELKTTEISTRTSMFIATQITIVKRQEQPECPSINKYIHKLWYNPTMEYSWSEKGMKY